MPLPPALTLKPLHAKILHNDASGTPATGLVTFEIEEALRDSADNVILGPTTYTGTLDVTGQFTISLPATDAAGISPSGWTYLVTVDTDAWTDTFRIAVPAAAPEPLELADIAPAVPPTALVTYVLASTVGQVGGPAGPLDADGLIPAEQVPGGGGGGNPASTVTDETTYGVAKAVGTSSLYARGDHSHGSPSLTSATPAASAVADTAAVGTATTPARADHRHGRESFGAVTAQTSFGLSSSDGTASTPARSDHRHGTPANPGGGSQVHKTTGFVTSGDVSATSGAFAQVGPDLTIAAAAGDALVLSPSVLCLAGSDTQFEAATRVSGADQNWWSSGTGTSRWPGGLGGWYVEAGNAPVTCAERYTVQAGDIVAGQVTVRFYARSTGSTRTVKGDSNYPIRWSLTNIGPDS